MKWLSAVERLALGVTGFLASTWVLGWWGVPLVAGLWRLADRQARSWPIGAAAFLSWVTLLGWLGSAPAKQVLAVRLAAILGVPPLVPGLVTPVLAGALALAAALAVDRVRRLAPAAASY